MQGLNCNRDQFRAWQHYSYENEDIYIEAQQDFEDLAVVELVRQKRSGRMLLSPLPRHHRRNRMSNSRWRRSGHQESETPVAALMPTVFCNSAQGLGSRNTVVGRNVSNGGNPSVSLIANIDVSQLSESSRATAKA